MLEAPEMIDECSLIKIADFLGLYCVSLIDAATLVFCDQRHIHKNELEI